MVRSICNVGVAAPCGRIFISRCNNSRNNSRSAASPVVAEIQQLRALPIEALVERYISEFGKPPKLKQREFLWKRICWKLQERRLGGLSNVAKATLEHYISQIQLPDAESRRTIAGKLRLPSTKCPPQAGAVLTREYRGQLYHVRLQDDGRFLLEETGVPYKSLSAVAHAITGSHWNGKLFFGLTTRKNAKNKKENS